jgi:hypothetical protein
MIDHSAVPTRGLNAGGYEHAPPSQDWCVDRLGVAS